ncbi:MAG TPA: MaoC family dehydratase [Solirubrobacterales bacterium]
MTATTEAGSEQVVAGPWFEDLVRGELLGAPAITLTAGHAVAHQALIGDRLRLPLDATLSARVLGGEGGSLAHPALVWDVSIGQSTGLTQRVIANLFYRGLVFRRFPLIGDTLRTTTEVVALRRNRKRPGRAATGLAALRVRTTDQEGRAVLDFWRCAMLPLRDAEMPEGPADDLDAIPTDLDLGSLGSGIKAWDLAAYSDGLESSRPPVRAGDRFTVAAGDVVSGAPELARLSLNIAAAHHDATGPLGRRLVYGGHTIGLAAAQLTRALPDLLTIVAWQSCDHLNPVYEGDTLFSKIEVERVDPLSDGGSLLHLRSRVRAVRAGAADESVDVLDWRLVGVTI